MEEVEAVADEARGFEAESSRDKVRQSQYVSGWEHKARQRKGKAARGKTRRSGLRRV